MRRGWLLLGMSACLAGSLLFAKPGTVKTKDGQTLTGDVQETGDGVSITVHNITTTIPQANVASVQYAGNIEQEYKTRADAIGSNASAHDHLVLARWLLDNNAFDLAFEEVAKAQQVEPNNADATALFETIRNNRRLYMDSHTDTPTAAPAAIGAPVAAPAPAPAADTGAPATPPPAAPEKKYLSDADINSLRQHEWRGSGEDSNVGVKLENGVKQRYAATLQDPSAFNQSNVQDQGWTILNSGTPDMAKDVKLTKDPASLRVYRQVQPLILNMCARCHDTNNGAPGHFGLFRDTSSEGATYTNFLILLETVSKPAGNRPVVDREHPNLSLLLQYSLPANVADFHHPASPDFRAPMQTADDPRYKKLQSWIQDDVNPIDQRYGIDYTLPGKDIAPATNPVPATAPAPTVPPN